MKVYVTRALPDAILNELDEFDVDVWKETETPVPEPVLREVITDCDGLLCLLTDKVTDQLLAGAERLKVVSNLAVGYDNIDVDSCTKRSIVVTNTPGVLTEATADLTFGLLLAAARRIPEAERLLRSDGWSSWSLLFMAGRDVSARTLGVVGMGRIGTAVVRRAVGFGMRVLYSSRRRSELAEQLGAEHAALDELLRAADYVSLHVPLTDDTRHLIGSTELGLMKPTAILVNTARGAIVNESALITALKNGVIAGAALDVMEQEPISSDHPLCTLSNVVLTPHIGSASIESRMAMARLAVDNLSCVLKGKRPQFVVNSDVWSDSGGTEGKEIWK